MKYYTGIGSRQTPKDILKLMEDIAFKLAQKGYILRSGAAGGADTAWNLAKAHGVPCFNLYDEQDKQRLIKFVESE